MIQVTDLTECLLCGEKFTGPRIAIIGKPAARLEQLLISLGSHLNTKHPAEAQALDLHGAAYIGMLFLRNFKSTDQQLNQQRDRLRWQIHQQTLNARFSDESLREQCGALAMRLIESFDNDEGCPDIAQRFTPILIEVFTGMRDVLEEPNKYAVAGVVTN